MNKVAHYLGFKSFLEKAEKTKLLVKEAIQKVRNSRVSDSFMSGFIGFIKRASIPGMKKLVKKTVKTFTPSAQKAQSQINQIMSAKPVTARPNPISKNVQSKVNQIMPGSTLKPPPKPQLEKAPAAGQGGLDKARRLAVEEYKREGLPYGMGAKKEDTSILGGFSSLARRLKGLVTGR